MVIDNILKSNVRGYWILLGTCPSCTTPLSLDFPHTLHLWPHKETARSRGSGQTPLHPSRSPVLGIWTASAHLHPIPTTSASLGRRVHLLAAARGAGGCPKASAPRQCCGIAFALLCGFRRESILGEGLPARALVLSQKSLGSTAVIQPMGQGGSRADNTYILTSLNCFPSP